ncbi:MAG: YciI family protein [Actinomycetota bacterium]
MKYALLIYGDESDKTASPDPGMPGFEEMMGGYAAFSAAVEEAGVWVGGEPLEDTSTSTSVRLRDGETLTTDGPFAETKEQLGGFYILDCESLDEAVKWAAQIPHAATGTVEVRPVPNFE